MKDSFLTQAKKVLIAGTIYSARKAINARDKFRGAKGDSAGVKAYPTRNTIIPSRNIRNSKNS
jgi:hypothetical protein